MFGNKKKDEKVFTLNINKYKEFKVNSYFDIYPNRCVISASDMTRGCYKIDADGKKTLAPEKVDILNITLHSQPEAEIFANKICDFLNKEETKCEDTQEI